MDVFEITLPAGYSPVALAVLIEQAAGACGLSISQITTLRTYPGSTHWHLKRPGVPGTLELTSWPQAGRLWFSVHANRQATWVASAIESLTARIVQAQN
jgi:hypothetical protein